MNNATEYRNRAQQERLAEREASLPLQKRMHRVAAEKWDMLAREAELCEPHGLS